MESFIGANQLKLFILGSGRHGKDTVAEIIRDDFGLTFQSSSLFVAEKVCRPYMAEVVGITYDTLEECYEDRHNHRTHWYNAIKAYNAGDLSRLSRELFFGDEDEEGLDMYVGIRDRDEFLASRDIADLSIWVDASERVKYADPTIKIKKEDADVVILNNEVDPDVVELRRRVHRLMKSLGFAPFNEQKPPKEVIEAGIAVVDATVSRMIARYDLNNPVRQLEEDIKAEAYLKLAANVAALSSKTEALFKNYVRLLAKTCFADTIRKDRVITTPRSNKATKIDSHVFSNKKQRTFDFREKYRTGTRVISVLTGVPPTSIALQSLGEDAEHLFDRIRRKCVIDWSRYFEPGDAAIIQEFIDTYSVKSPEGWTTPSSEAKSTRRRLKSKVARILEQECPNS